MTDDEILFDFFTVEERQRVLSEAENAWQSEQDEQAPQQPGATMDLLPSTTVPTRNTTTSVTADREDFIRWYEAEVGPWPEKR